MSNPFAVSPSASVIQDPGAGGAIVQGVAAVLAAQQNARETAFRAQQIAQQQEQQAALAQYYQGQIGVQNRQEDRLDSTASAERAGRAQVGGAMRRSLSGTTPTMPSTTTSVSPGNGGALETAAADPNGAGVFHQILTGAAGALDPHMAAVFGGVADENLPDAVKGVQEAKKLTAAPEMPEMPTAAKEFMFAQQLSSIDPKLAKFFIDNWVNKPGVSVTNNLGGQPTPYSKEFDEKAAGATFGVLDNAKQAFQSMPIIDEAYRTLSKGNVYTGFFAKPSLLAGRIAASFGVPDAKIKVSDTQTLLKLTGEQALGYLRNRDLGSGTAVSDSDREFVFTLSGRDLSQDKRALFKTLRINFGTAIMRQGEAVDQLKQDAVNYPERSAQIGRDITRLQKQQQVGWTTYTRMLKEEGFTEDDIRARMIGSGVPDPDPILRRLQSVKAPSIQQEADSIVNAMRAK